MSASAEFVRRHLLASADVKRAAAEQCAGPLAEAAARVVASFQTGGKLLFCGNGGSAADCQHLAAEFTSALNHDRPRAALPALALTTDTSFLTANANDFGFDHVFERQVEALGRRGDVLVGITTSGNSPNVLRAFEKARALGLVTVLLSGEGGGKAQLLADVAVCVPSRDTQHIQEVHIAAGHVLCALVEDALFGA
ncbi:MAG: D-sedoheptulose 7-phosphate isomerase [Gemmatimonadetes bacterium]|nr:D-sedoheptulose 7-phosphate isomerase [Gemmatimonadota bacterium]